MYRSVLVHKTDDPKKVIEMVERAVIKASELQRHSGKVLKRAANEGVHLIVERAGYPVAVMISFEEYEELMRDRARNALRESVLELGPEAERQGLSEEKLMEELDQIKKGVYQKTYGGKKG